MFYISFTNYSVFVGLWRLTGFCAFLYVCVSYIQNHLCIVCIFGYAFDTFRSIAEHITQKLTS